METIIFGIAWLSLLTFLAYHKINLRLSAIVIALGLIFTTIVAGISFFLLLGWLVFISLSVALLHPEIKTNRISKPLFKSIKSAMPALSETEKVALESGTVGWEGELFNGKLDFTKLLSTPKSKLSQEEIDYINGPVQEICEAIDDWELTHKLIEFPEHIWQLIKKHKFFALNIPKEYGGLGFSEMAHSEILTVLAGRSLALACTVSVPNALGPGELLEKYGTKEQKDYYLPRLASCDEIPCFALTGPEAGSDATAIPDKGIVCKQQFDGKEQIGILLNWDKHYITLAPKATILGLAFQLYDPEKLLSDIEARGITLALIPTKTKGVITGKRHLPLNIPFPNGPTKGTDVFIPLDWIIGGQEMIGQGWRMLVECLATGRSISLPSSAIGGARLGAMAASSYASIRRQFRTKLANFEGIMEPLGRMGGYLYISEAMRYFTVTAIDRGEKPALPGAISKYHVTELCRKTSQDVMDVLAGKAIMLGPKNFIGRQYQGTPIAITVEGANILTRSMIIFGQGAIRCHPFALKEIQATQADNFEEFEKVLWEHMSHTVSNIARSLTYAVSFAKFVKTPTKHPVKAYYQQLTRASSCFAVVSDVIMATFGGKLKFKESISAQLGDLFSNMYLISAVLKRFHDEGEPLHEYALVEFSCDYLLNRFWYTMDNILRDLPKRPLAWFLKLIIMPFGHECHPPKFSEYKKVAKLLTTKNHVRDKIFANIFIPEKNNASLRLLKQAFELSIEIEPELKIIYDAIKDDKIITGTLKENIEQAFAQQLLSQEQYAKLSEYEKLYSEIIRVDEFELSELAINK